MKKNGIVLALILLFNFIVFCGCTENTENISNDGDKNLFIGSWSGPGIRYFEFYPDNTCMYTGITYTWSVQTGTLSIAHSNGVRVAYTYAFSEDNSMLTLTEISNHETSVYTRR